MKEMNNYTVNFTTPGASDSFTTFYVPPPNSLEMYMFSFNVLFGFPTHSYVIWLIVTGTGNGITSEFFNLNLSVCEIGNCLNCLLFVLNTWTSSLFNLENFLKGLIVTGRPLCQCLICVERYLAVIHPVTFLKYKLLRYRLMCCTVVWIITVGSCLCCMFISPLLTNITLTWFLSVQFFIYLSIQLFCCVAVLRALKQSGPGERGREREEENNMKKRAFHLILITTISMVITYVPYIISGLIIMTGHIVYEVWVTGMVCYTLAGFVQPVLYLRRAGKLCCFSANNI